MAGGRADGAIWQARGVIDLISVGSMTDGQLVERHLAGRDEAAFRALVARHGPMVLRV